MLKIFSFVASCAGEKSHTASFSDTLAEAIQKELGKEGEKASYERLTGADIRIDYCRSCDNCFLKGSCSLDTGDDMAMLKQKILDCDIFLLGTPVYLWQMSGLAKSFLDRISYWTHRYELLGKPAVVFSTTDTSYGPEVSAELAKLLRFTGAPVIDAGTESMGGIEIPPEETAKKLTELWKNPGSGITFLQQNAFLSRVIMVRKYLRLHKDDKEIVDEMKVFKDRGLDRYVLLEEAIRDLS